MGKVGDVKLANVNKVGEDELFNRLATGTTLTDLLKEVGIGYKLWARWLDSSDGRRQRYADAQEQSAHFFASRAVSTAVNTHEMDSTINSAKLQVETDKWMAAKLNPQYDTRHKEVAVNISVGDLHAEAAALLREVSGDVIEGEAEDVSDAEP
tara:strand:- start:978 stop:1436 length:459 start_codon:yes stop_codon:yes gene_type:complete